MEKEFKVFCIGYEVKISAINLSTKDNSIFKSDVHAGDIFLFKNKKSKDEFITELLTIIKKGHYLCENKLEDLS